MSCEGPCVSRWLVAAAARVRAQVTCGICGGGQSGAEVGFLPSTSVSLAKSRSTDYPTPIAIQGWSSGPVDSVPLHPKTKKKKKVLSI
jgi:hypothetical protein